ncbi:hypothetical protein ABZY09_36960 [Streptomyces sp. NPDC002928]|uniref:hypothetical protein n=1 Tax=Streptomyces sp. NPDC002928 TaxID=3154440 RepID=UPI0033A4BBDD
MPEPRDPEPDTQPTPDLVPDPESEPEPEHVALSLRERLRQAGWTHVITVSGAALATLAAIGGLWAQAVASYWTQQTAKDQLSQSREDSEREEQAQASQITYWLEYPGPLQPPTLHILNRSLDPVTDVRLGFSLAPEMLFVGYVADLPPCTEDVLNTRDMVLRTAAKKDVGKVWDPREALRPRFTQLRFIDSHGIAWERSPTKLRYLVSSEVRSLVAPEVTILVWEGRDPVGFIVLGNPRVQKTNVCGDERK